MSAVRTFERWLWPRGGLKLERSALERTFSGTVQPEQREQLVLPILVAESMQRVDVGSLCCICMRDDQRPGA